MRFATRSVGRAVVSIGTRMLVSIGVALVATASSFAQNDAQDRVAVRKQSIADDNQGLHPYQWVETTQVIWKGNEQPPSRQLCRYDSDGQVQKIPIGSVSEPLGETGVMAEHLRELTALIGAYLPPDPREIEHAYQAQPVSFHPTGAIVNLVFKDYVRPGDQMTLAFDPAAKKITSVSINTDIGPAKDAVTLRVLMASLPDGTSYVQQTVLTADKMQLARTTTNSRYRILGLSTPNQAEARPPTRVGP